MPLIPRLTSLVRNLAHRSRVEHELTEELDGYVEELTAQNVREGLSAQDARRAALVEVGGVQRVKENIRDVHVGATLAQVWQDLAYAVRNMRRHVGFSSTAIVTLALGLGMTTSVCTLIYSVAMRRLPLRDPESVVKVYQRFSGKYSRENFGSPYMVSYPEYVDYRDGVRSFSGLAAYSEVGLTVGGVESDRANGLLVTENYFSLLGVDAVAGRLFSAGACSASGTCSLAVLSYGYWQRRFGGDANIIGRTITLNGVPFDVLGIAAKAFRGTELSVPDVWMPLSMQARVETAEDLLARPNAGWLEVVGRLKPGASATGAQSEAAVIARRADEAHPGRKSSVTVVPGTLLEVPVTDRQMLSVALGIVVLVGLILLIVFANITNLLLVRAVTRQREIGVRLALGATRSRLLRQLLTETALLATAGGAAGLLLALWLPPLLIRMLPAVGTDLGVRPDGTVITSCIVASALAGLLFGLAPARSALRPDISALLKSEGARRNGPTTRWRLSSALAILQIAVALVLLIGAGLLVRGLQRAQSVDLGFDPHDLLIVSTDVYERSSDETHRVLDVQEIRARLRAVNGVRSVSTVGDLPFVGRSSTSITVEGREADRVAGSAVFVNTVSAGFFGTARLPLLRGREFTDAEARTGAPVAIVSASMARHFWPGADPIGQRFTQHDSSRSVVGVARDASTEELAEVDPPTFYRPGVTGSFLVRTDPNAPAIGPAARKAVLAVNRSLFVRVDRMDDHLDRLAAPARAGSLLAGALGLLALVLASAGVYGVIAFAASQRRKEVGVRIALGATNRDVVRLLMRQGGRIVGTGIVIGVIAAIGASGILKAALFGLSPLDPVAFVGVSAFLAAVAMLACYVPARGATTVDPVITLRDD